MLHSSHYLAVFCFCCYLFMAHYRDRLSVSITALALCSQPSDVTYISSPLIVAYMCILMLIEHVIQTTQGSARQNRCSTVPRNYSNTKLNKMYFLSSLLKQFSFLRTYQSYWMDLVMIYFLHKAKDVPGSQQIRFIQQFYVVFL